MFVGAAIPNTRLIDDKGVITSQALETDFARFEIAQSDHNEFVIAADAFQNSSQQAFAQIYTLVLGLRRANLFVECSGEFASLLPSEAPPIDLSKSRANFQKVGVDHDLKASKKFRFRPEQIVRWYHYFGSITTLTQASQADEFPGKHMAGDHCYMWKLPEGVVIRSTVENSRLIDHQVLGCTLPLNAIRNGLPLSHPMRRRTWGEAWMAHEVTGQILTGLVRLDDEVAIFRSR